MPNSSNENSKDQNHDQVEGATNTANKDSGLESKTETPTKSKPKQKPIGSFDAEKEKLREAITALEKKATESGIQGFKFGGEKELAFEGSDLHKALLSHHEKLKGKLKKFKEYDEFISSIEDSLRKDHAAFHKEEKLPTAPNFEEKIKKLMTVVLNRREEIERDGSFTKAPEDIAMKLDSLKEELKSLYEPQYQFVRERIKESSRYGISYKTSPYEGFHQEISKQLKTLIPHDNKPLEEFVGKFLEGVDRFLEEKHFGLQKTNANQTAENIDAEFKERVAKFLEDQGESTKNPISELEEKKKKAFQEILDKQKARLAELHREELHWIRSKIEEKDGDKDSQATRLRVAFINRQVMKKRADWGQLYQLEGASKHKYHGLSGSGQDDVMGFLREQYTPGRMYQSPSGAKLYLEKNKDGLYTVRAIRSGGWLSFGSGDYQAAKMEEMVFLLKQGCREMQMADNSKFLQGSALVKKQDAWLHAALNMQFDFFVKDRLEKKDLEPKTTKYKNQYVITKEDVDSKSKKKLEKYALHYFDNKGKQHTLKVTSDQLKAALEYSRITGLETTGKNDSKKLDLNFKIKDQIEALIIQATCKEIKDDQGRVINYGDPKDEESKAWLLMTKDGKVAGIKNQASMRISDVTHSMFDNQAAVKAISFEEAAVLKEKMATVNNLYNLHLQLGLSEDESDKQKAMMSSGKTAQADEAGASLEKEDDSKHEEDNSETRAVLEQDEQESEADLDQDQEEAGAALDQNQEGEVSRDKAKKL